MKKLEDNSRRVMEITECEILEDGTRQLHTLYRLSLIHISKELRAKLSATVLEAYETTVQNEEAAVS